MVERMPKTEEELMNLFKGFINEFGSNLFHGEDFNRQVSSYGNYRAHRNLLVSLIVDVLESGSIGKEKLPEITNIYRELEGCDHDENGPVAVIRSFAQRDDHLKDVLGLTDDEA